MALQNYYTKLNNFYQNWVGQRSEEAQAQAQATSDKLATQYSKSEIITSLNMGVIPFAQTPKPIQTPISTSNNSTNPFQLENQTPVSYFIDRNTLEVKSTAKGSVVPSPQADAMNRFYSLGVSADLLERREFYKEVESIFSTSVIAAKSRDDLNEGAFGDKIATKIKPAPGLENDQQAIDQAGTLDALWQPTFNIMTANGNDWFLKLGRAFLTFGNAPIEIDATDYGTIVDLPQLSPYAMQINSDYRLKFRRNQNDCYTQFDDLGKYWLNSWPEALIIWPMTKEFYWHRYGLTRLFAALACARALVKSEEMLADSREAAQLEKYVIVRDLVNQSASNEQLEELKANTREAEKLAGLATNPFKTSVYNGASEVGMIAPPTAFFKDLQDIYWRAGGVAARFGTHLLRFIQSDTTPNRAVIDRLDAIAYVCQQHHRDHLLGFVADETISRQVAWYNGLMAQSTNFYRLGSSSQQINRAKITLEIYAENDETADILDFKAKGAVNAREKGLIDWETAVEAQAGQQGKDPEKLKVNLAKEGKAPKYFIDEYYQKTGTMLYQDPSQQPQQIAVNSMSYQRPNLRVV